MPSFKDNDFSERRQAADSAKRATLERFHTQKDDPATAERKAARSVAAQAQDSRVKARTAAKKKETERRTVADKIREEEVSRLAVDISGDKVRSLTPFVRKVRESSFARQRFSRGL